MGHRHAIYINVRMLMYIACLCPNLVSVHFYAIPILHFRFPKFFIYLYNTVLLYCVTCTCIALRGVLTSALQESQGLTTNTFVMLLLVMISTHAELQVDGYHGY